MKKIVVLTVAMLAAGTSTAFAERPARWEHKQSYDWCEDKARNLHRYENRSARDGVITRDERRHIEILRADLRRSCGGGRWHPSRGWHY